MIPKTRWSLTRGGEPPRSGGSLSGIL